MGNNLKCHMGESQEEIIERVFTMIPFSEVDVNDIYREFISCITPSVVKQEEELDYFKYTTMINRIINKESNNCKLVHLDYFDNLRKIDNAILIIGTILIYISKGVKDEKIEILTKHYIKYNGGIKKESFKLFIMNLIDANTTFCINAYENSNEGNKQLSEVYSEKRKKKLCEYIMMNSNLVEKKYDENSKVENKEKKMIKEILELNFCLLKGEFIRNWINEEYEKEKPKEETNPCLF